MIEEQSNIGQHTGKEEALVVPTPTEKAHRFAHQAMATTFEVFIAGKSEKYARQVANEAFTVISSLEKELSRFDPTTDIARINRLKPGETLRVGYDTYQFLGLARKLEDMTGGAFDVTVGPLMECWRGPDGSPREPDEREIKEARRRMGLDRLAMSSGDPSTPIKEFTVQLKKAEDGDEPGPILVDPGGIGKGYALDQVADVFDRWDVDSALLHGGGSTALAIGPGPDDERGWQVGVGGAEGVAESLGRYYLRDRALSGSGLEQQGEHVMNPATGRPIKQKRSAWSLCPSAAVADALSTAFMVMPLEDIEELCEKQKEISATVIVQTGSGSGSIHRFGDWD